MMEIILHEATPTQLQATRMILGQPLMYRGIKGQAWLAYFGHWSQIVGAACLWFEGKTGRCWVRVVKPRRRQGIGRALLKTVINRAIELKIKQLRPIEAVFSQEAQEFLQSMQFEIEHRLTIYESTLTQVRFLVEPVYHYLQQRERIPNNVEILDLIEADKQNLLPDAINLVVKELGGIPERMIKRMQGQTDDSFRLSDSLILVKNEKVVAIGLCRFLEEVQAWSSEAIVVDSAYRGSWASVMLRQIWIERTQGRGKSDRLRFEVREDYQDTAKLARRCGASVVGCKHLYLHQLQ